MASDSRLRPDRCALERGDLSKAGAEKSRFDSCSIIKKTKRTKEHLFNLYILCLCLFSLEERQRAEKRNREAKGHRFTPRWFELTDEVTPTPWGDLEIYRYNGKYTEHRASIDNSEGIIIDVDNNVESTEFNPWQYSNLSEIEVI